MKVLLVEDHELFRDGVTLILESLDEPMEISWCDTAAGAEEFVSRSEPLDLVLLDYNLPDGTGLQCLQQIHTHHPNTPAIILSAEQDSGLIQQTLEAGARGFITKSSSSKVMLSAIQLVLSGGLYVPPEMLGAARNQRPPVSASAAGSTGTKVPLAPAGRTRSHSLTERQQDVLSEMIKGLSNKEIARELNMSPSTVKVHVAAILREFEVKNRTQAVNYARQHNLV